MAMSWGQGNLQPLKDRERLLVQNKTLNGDPGLKYLTPGTAAHCNYESIGAEGPRCDTDERKQYARQIVLELKGYEL